VAGAIRYNNPPSLEQEMNATNSMPAAPPDPETVARKLDQFFELCELGKELALEGIRYRHPNASSAELHRLLAERLAIFRAGKWRRHE
jgi:hypothetical protein